MRRGDLIAGRYRLDERIGAGGMGVVWRATDASLGRTVALKRSLDGRRIQGEASIGANLQHANIITVYDTVTDDGEQWLVMEYLPSRSLAELATDGPVDPRLAATIGAQIASALGVMHARGMVHRDVTPANVLVTDDGVAKLADLGLTRWADVTRSGDAHGGGTVAYVAPEAFSGTDGAPADVFSLGATLFDAVEGHSPWGSTEQGPYVMLRRAMSGDQEQPVRAGVLEPVLADLLQADPGKRPTATEATTRLAALGDPGAVLVTTPLHRPSRLATAVRSPGRMSLIALLAVVAVLVPVLVLTLGGDREGEGSTGRQSDAATVRDERAADPCRLLDKAALDAVTEAKAEVLVDREYGTYNRCGLVQELSKQDGDVAQVQLELLNPDTSLPVTGELGAIEEAPAPDGECGRQFALADGHLVRVTAKILRGGEQYTLCQLAKAVAGAAQFMVTKDPVPSRTTPLSQNSLAATSACDTLAKADLGPVLGEDTEKPEPQFGDWACTVSAVDTEELDGPEVSILFAREWNDGTVGDGKSKRDIGAGASAYVGDADGAEGSVDCSADLPRREYRMEGTTNPDAEWIEFAAVTVYRDANDSRASEVCADALAVARAVVGQLPAT